MVRIQNILGFLLLSTMLWLPTGSTPPYGAGFSSIVQLQSRCPIEHTLPQNCNPLDETHYNLILDSIEDLYNPSDEVQAICDEAREFGMKWLSENRDMTFFSFSHALDNRLVGTHRGLGTGRVDDVIYIGIRVDVLHAIDLETDPSLKRELFRRIMHEFGHAIGVRHFAGRDDSWLDYCDGSAVPDGVRVRY